MWKAGDIAVIDFADVDVPPDMYTKYQGVRCQLVQYLGLCHGERLFVRNAWRTDLGCVVNEKCLRKPQYDGMKVVSWSECVWKPTVTT